MRISPDDDTTGNEWLDDALDKWKDETRNG